MMWFLALVVSLVTPNDLNSRGPLPPRSYELALTAAYSDVSVSLNGVPVLELRAEGRSTHRILLNAFLKARGNALDVTVTPAFPGQNAKGALTVQSYAAGGGPESIVTEMDRPIEPPFTRRFNFDAPETPDLAVWGAGDRALDDGAHAEITAALADFQEQVVLAIQARDTRRLVTLFADYSGNRDAARFLPIDSAGNVTAVMLDDLAPVVNDPEARQLTTAPPPTTGDLAFRQAGRFVIASRKDGGAVLGFMFRGDHGPGGVTLDRPVLGYVEGKWIILQDIPLPRS